MAEEREAVRDGQETWREAPGDAVERAPKEERPVRRGEKPRQQIRKVREVGRRRFSAEDKIRVVMEGMRGEEPVSVICRREQVHTTVYYRWLKDFLEAGKGRLRGDSLREAGRDEVAALRSENERLKRLVGEYALELVTLKKSVTGTR